MAKVSIGNEKTVTLDKCKKNHGLWLNKGELESVLELAGTESRDKVVNLLRNMFIN